MIYLESILLLAGLLLLFATLLVLAERFLLNYGPCSIHIEGRPDPIVVTGGDDLLSALASRGVHVPSLCGRRGTCGHCRITVLDGGGPPLPTELLNLTPDDLRAGTRLACQLKVRADLSIRLSPALLSAQRYRARVVGVLPLSPSLKEIRLRLEDPPSLSFSPGQYVQVEIPVDSPEPVYRAYSIASPLYETAEIALDVELVPGGIGSTWLHRLNPGDLVSFTGPYGDFRLSDDPSVEVVCVAGGCGLAPMKSIVYSVLDRWPGRPCWLFYGVRDARHAFHLPVYRRLAQQYPQLHFVCAVSHSPDDARRLDAESGLIHSVLQTHLPPGPSRQAFLCGPPEMLDAVTEILDAKGVIDIHADKL